MYFLSLLPAILLAAPLFFMPLIKRSLSILVGDLRLAEAA
jgi:hypothetical protein